MRESSRPAAPVGYREPYKLVRSVSWLELPPGDVGLFAGAVGLFGGLAVTVRDSTAVLGVFWDVAMLESVDVYLALVTAAGVGVALHEVVHAVAGYFSGCHVRFHRWRFGVATRLRGGFLTRQADAVITLAPAVMLTLGGFPLLIVMDSSVAAAIVVTGLVANTAGIGSDLADMLTLRKFPPGTLLYYTAESQLAYEPTTTG